MNAKAAEAGHGKSALIEMLIRKHGFSRRKAEKGVRAVFFLMRRALRRGEVVELPVGWIRLASMPAQRSGRRKFHKVGGVLQFAKFPRKMIRFTPKEELIERAPFAPPPPRPLPPEVAAKAEEVEQLFDELIETKQEIGDNEFIWLMLRLNDNLDWLLARMRKLKKDGNRFKDFFQLAVIVTNMSYIRPASVQAKRTPVVKTPPPVHPERKGKPGRPRKSPPKQTVKAAKKTSSGPGGAKRKKK